jgi:hypothetical protein
MEDVMGVSVAAHSGIFCLGDAINTDYKFMPAAKLKTVEQRVESCFAHPFAARVAL